MIAHDDGADVFLTLGLGAFDLGIAARAVSAILPEAEWQGDRVDLLAGLGMHAGDEGKPGRVLLVDTEQGRVALRTRSTLQIRHATTEEILPLPDLVGGALRPLWGGVAFVDGHVPLLVLDLNGLSLLRRIT